MQQSRQTAFWAELVGGHPLAEGTDPFPLCPTLTTAHLEFCILCGIPQYKRNQLIYQWVQQKATKSIRRLEYMTYEAILQELELSSPNKRRPRMNLIAVFNYLIGGHTKHSTWLFLAVLSDKIRHNGHKLEERKVWKH